jgi:homogentisate 1,2-dioxygenase
MIYGILHSGSMPATQNCKRAFSSADGDFLIVPQEGILIITTEFGKVSILTIMFNRTFRSRIVW